MASDAHPGGHRFKSQPRDGLTNVAFVTLQQIIW